MSLGKVEMNRIMRETKKIFNSAEKKKLRFICRKNWGDSADAENYDQKTLQILQENFL